MKTGGVGERRRKIDKFLRRRRAKGVVVKNIGSGVRGRDEDDGSRSTAEKRSLDVMVSKREKQKKRIVDVGM